MTADLPFVDMVRGRPSKKGTKREGVGKASAEGTVPDVYKEMLVDAVSSPGHLGENERASKRRRIGGRIVTQRNEESPSYQSDQTSRAAESSDLDALFEDVEPVPQRIIQSDSEDSATSDMDWEEVQLGNRAPQEDTPEPESAAEEGLNLVLRAHSDEYKATLSGKIKRKPMTAEDKRFRIELHKLHLCCLLVHVYIRNHWCNDEKIYVGGQCIIHKLPGR